jgi:hypothetical protein
VSRFGPATPLEDILEADWSKQVCDLARTLGFPLIYHTFSSKRSAMGFPDLVLIREREIKLELKREKTKPTEDQKRWIAGLLKASAEVYIARPSDLSTLGVILAGRGDPFAKPGELQNAALYLREKTRSEVSK